MKSRPCEKTRQRGDSDKGDSVTWAAIQNTGVPSNTSRNAPADTHYDAELYTAENLHPLPVRYKRAGNRSNGDRHMIDKEKRVLRE